MIELALILLGIFYIVAGFLMFIFTDASKDIIRNVVKLKNIKAMSVSALVVGIMLIAGSSYVSRPWITVTLGTVALLKGLFFIFGPKKHINFIIDWWLKASDSVYKSWAVVAFLIGILLLLIL